MDRERERDRQQGTGTLRCLTPPAAVRLLNTTAGEGQTSAGPHDHNTFTEVHEVTSLHRRTSVT